MISAIFDHFDLTTKLVMYSNTCAEVWWGLGLGLGLGLTVGVEESGKVIQKFARALEYLALGKREGSYKK